jgi:prepilin-type N-terminal cleavage/methylation domain-containing protein
MSTPRKGFSLIEIVVAMTILSILLLSLAKISTAIGVRDRANDLLAKRNAALQLEANRWGAVPFASLSPPRTDEIKAMEIGTFKYNRRLTMTQLNNARYTVKVVIIPDVDPKKMDSVTFDRSRVAVGSPICVGC